MNMKNPAILTAGAFLAAWGASNFALERFLGLTEEEIKRNEMLWEEENKEEVPMDPSGSDLRNIGISSGDFQTDIDTADEIESGDKNGNNIEYIDGNTYYANNIIKEFLFNPKIKILKHYSDIINLFPDIHLDWIYIDGAHDYTTVKNDLINSYSKIKQNGYIMGHDYTTNMFPGLVKAVDEFCLEYNLNIEYLTHDGCPSYLIIKK